MKFDVLTNSLSALISSFDAGVTLLEPYIQALLYSLMVICIIFLAIRVVMDESSQKLYYNFMMFFFILFWGWFTVNFNDLAKTFVTSFMEAGEIAGGAPPPVPGVPSASCELENPSCVMGHGTQAIERLDVLLEEADFGLVDSLVIGISKLLIHVCYIIIALQGALALLEYYFFLIIAGFLMPFGILQRFQFLSEKAIGAIVGCAIKLMSISFIFAVIEPTIGSFEFKGADGKITMNEILAFLATMIFFAWLAWKIPDKAQSFLSGSPSLSLAGLVQSGVSAARGTSTAAGIGVKAAGATASGARAAAGGIQKAAYVASAVGQLARR